METILGFYKTEEGEWYADLPRYIEEGGDVDQLEMIAGSDTFLDILAEGKNSVKLQVSDKQKEGFDWMVKTEEDFAGSYYEVKVLKGKEIKFSLWLCNVTTWVFGKFPNTIWFKL